MKSLIFCLSIFLINISFAQVLTQDPGSKGVKAALGNKLCVVLTGYEPVDAVIKKSFEEYWKVGDFSFISGTEMQNQITDETKSFCMELQIEVTSGTITNTKSYYGIINGGKKRISNYSDNDIVVLGPKNIYTDEYMEMHPTAYTYVIKGMNDALLRAKNGEVTGKNLKSLEPVNTKFPEVAKSKTLIINKDLKQSAGKNEGEAVVPAEVLKGYPYKYKFVSREEFEEYLKGDDDSVLLMYPVVEISKHILIFDPSTKATVYYGFGRGLTVTEKDMKAVAAGES